MAARLGITNDSMVMIYSMLSHSVQIGPQNNPVRPIGLFFFSHFTDEEIEAQWVVLDHFQDIESLEKLLKVMDSAYVKTNTKKKF